VAAFEGDSKSAGNQSGHWSSAIGASKYFHTGRLTSRYTLSPFNGFQRGSLFVRTSRPLLHPTFESDISHAAVAPSFGHSQFHPTPLRAECYSICIAYLRTFGTGIAFSESSAW